MKDRNIIVLKKIVKYSDEINETITRFDLDLDKFKKDNVVKNAIAMCLLQIGELVGRLTDEFKTEYNKMIWRNIIAIRNSIGIIVIYPTNFSKSFFQWNDNRHNIIRLHTFSSILFNIFVFYTLSIGVQSVLLLTPNILILNSLLEVYTSCMTTPISEYSCEIFFFVV